MVNKNKKKIFLLIFVFISGIKGQNMCDSDTSLLCSIRDQIISPTADFVLSNRNSSFPVSYMMIISTTMQKIPPSLFPNNPTISMLSLSNNGLTEISSESFTNCNSLTSALIRNGFLTKIPSGTFKACSNILSLQITNHSITIMDQNAFEGLKNLGSLYLSNNLMTSLNSNLFATLSRLSLLDLTFNKLTTLDANIFRQNPLLAAIYLDNNEITSLPRDLFSSQKNLGSFKITSNKLTTFQSYGFRFSDYSLNQLTSFNFSTGEETLHVSYNFIRRLFCPDIDSLSVKRFYAQNNLLTNMLCIRDMKNLTDLNLTSNNIRPTLRALSNLENLRFFSIFNQQRFPRMFPRAFTNMSISNIYVDSFISFVNLRRLMPNIYLVGVTTRTWPCNRTQRVVNILTQQRIRIFYNYSSDRLICNITQPRF